MNKSVMYYCLGCKSLYFGYVWVCPRCKRDKFKKMAVLLVPLDIRKNIKLRSARKRKNLTQRKLAEIINVGAHNISSWELGKNHIDRENLKKLCAILEVREEEIFF